MRRKEEKGKIVREGQFTKEKEGRKGRKELNFIRFRASE
jgi:hypothetical protein